MGARSAAYLCQRVTNSVKYVASLESVNIINYLDDLCGVSTPETAYRDFEKLSEILENLGLKESKEKSVSPSTFCEFLGVQFDSVPYLKQCHLPQNVFVKSRS